MGRRYVIEKALIAMTALSAWAGIILQFLITSKTWPGLDLSAEEGTLRFFTYFTIQTNFLVAICLSSIFIDLKKNNGYFNRSSVQSAIALYIFVVGVVYHLLLSRLWKPERLQWVVDNLLHTIVPVLYILFWLIFTPSSYMKVGKAILWLIYPVFYFVWVLLQALYTGFYPYPFIDVESLGYLNSLLNASELLAVFFILGLVSIWVKRPSKTS